MITIAWVSDVTRNTLHATPLLVVCYFRGVMSKVDLFHFFKSEQPNLCIYIFTEYAN